MIASTNRAALNRLAPLSSKPPSESGANLTGFDNHAHWHLIFASPTPTVYVSNQAIDIGPKSVGHTTGEETTLAPGWKQYKHNDNHSKLQVQRKSGSSLAFSRIRDLSLNNHLGRWISRSAVRPS